VKIDWPAIIQYVIGGAAVSWPGVAVGLWLAVRKTKEHVDASTDAQTGKIEKITDDQTRRLLGHRAPGAGREYHGHGDEHG
jgi:hypothetical protein